MNEDRETELLDIKTQLENVKQQAHTIVKQCGNKKPSPLDEQYQQFNFLEEKALHLTLQLHTKTQIGEWYLR